MGEGSPLTALEVEMFIDSARIFIKAGNGGNGAVSFHREKYVAAGGPDGGDGGDGGNVIFIVDENVRTLADLRYKRHYRAKSGQDGSSSNRTGRSGENLIIKVPLGTLIKDEESTKVIADLTKAGQSVISAKGGKGGKGNQHFATSTRQVPNFAKSGDAGEERWVVLELKLLADVGLIGYPNVGKSTILSIVSSARPKIANYHFTTIEPNLGVVRLGEGKSFTMADIPGLIEGAHKGIGLGHEFLKHIERTRVLIHVVDVSRVEGRDPLKDFEAINRELEEYNPELAKKPQVVAANKIDVTGALENYKELKEVLEERGLKVFPISAASNKGLKELMEHVEAMLDDLPRSTPPAESAGEVVYEAKEEEPFTIIKDNDIYVVTGNSIRKLVGSTNFNDTESLQYFQRAIKKMGLIEALEERGVKEGDTVRLHDFEFDYIK
jgi:GTP-binding protein